MIKDVDGVEKEGRKGEREERREGGRKECVMIRSIMMGGKGGERETESYEGLIKC